MDFQREAYHLCLVLQFHPPRAMEQSFEHDNRPSGRLVLQSDDRHPPKQKTMTTMAERETLKMGKQTQCQRSHEVDQVQPINELVDSLKRKKEEKKEEKPPAQSHTSWNIK